MPPLFRRAAILGLGLMGGSLGLALHAHGAAETVAGYDALAGRAEQARERGAIDVAAASPGEAVRAADLVVLAAPVGATRDLLAASVPALAPHALVTDLGSTKRSVCAWAEALLPDPGCFVGGHPMAGREQSGIEAAVADLFAGAVWCLTPTPATDPAALTRAEALVQTLGARPLVLAPDRHDTLVAAISHLPMVAAVTLVETVAADPTWPEAAPLAAGGFRDTTRVASGSSAMARDICLTNGPAILAWLDAYQDELSRLRAAIVAGDAEAIEHVFAQARAAREAWLNSRGKG
ncbi:MAG TPA: prephenate dehydrogenase/arogenate dehydrogenase family protein [Ktedonobacterales bacterium]|nr:prephenate dehydrogenase/arogenate dehydrogenase family protein [Ktedonobacterales bacterium]